MFKLEQVDVAYDGLPVLHKIDLEVRAGEKIVLIGPSGAGKTTLLRELQARGGQKTAFIHQDHALVPKLSVFHNVYMGRLDEHGLFYNLRNLVSPHPRERGKIAAILDQLGLADKMREAVDRLSGGQRQRVAVARAIYRGAGVLLADEPVASVDPHQASRMLNDLLGAAETVLVSLHSLDLALDRFDRVIGMKSGRIDFDLSRDEVREDQLEELYG